MIKFRLAFLIALIFSAMVTLACGTSAPAATQPPNTVSPTPTVVLPPTATPVQPTATPEEPTVVLPPTAPPVLPTSPTEEPTSVSPSETLIPGGLSQEELDILQAELSANIEKWQQTAPSDYALEFRVSCNCATDTLVPVTIVVRDTNNIESVTYVESGEPVSENLDMYLTVGAMFDMIQEAIDMSVASLTVSYDPEMGYPTEAFIDRDFMMADEERGFSVSSLMPIEALTLGEIQSRLSSNREIWESSGRSNYQVQYSRNCFCLPEVTSPVIVAVSDGVIDSVTYAETGEPVGEEVRDLFPTVPGLFDILQDAIDQDAARIRVDYDAQLGYPLSIAIDYNTMMADEELGFTVSSLE